MYNFQDRATPTSNPPATGTPSFMEGLALESAVDLSSIPLAHTPHTGDEDEEIDPKASNKRTRTEFDHDEVPSSPSGSAKRQELDNPIPAVPVSSMPPTGSSKPPRLFGLTSR